MMLGSLVTTELKSTVLTATGPFYENGRVASWCVGKGHCVSNILFFFFFG